MMRSTVVFLSLLVVTNVSYTAAERTSFKPWSFQSGPDIGRSSTTAGSALYDPENNLLHFAGTVDSASQQFPRFFSQSLVNDDNAKQAGSDCFLATIQAPIYDDHWNAANWESMYRTGLAVGSMSCTAGLGLVETAGQRHAYALGMEVSIDPDTMDLSMTETLVDTLLKSSNREMDSRDFGAARDMMVWSDTTHRGSIRQKKQPRPNSASPLSMLGDQKLASVPMAMTTDPVLQRIYTISQESARRGSPVQVIHNNMTTASIVVLKRYSVVPQGDGSDSDEIALDYKTTINLQDLDAISPPFGSSSMETTRASSLVFVEKHNLLLLTGSATSSTKGSEDMHLHGFIAKLNPSTGKLAWYTPGAASKTISFRGDSIAAASQLDTLVEGLCLDPHQGAIFVVGTTTGPRQEQNNKSGGAFLTKLDFDSLEVLWEEQITGAQGFSCQVTPDGKHVYMAGNVRGGVTMKHKQVPRYYMDEATAGNSDDVFTSKLDASNGSVLWMSRVGSNEADFLARGSGLILDKYGNPLLYGTTYGLMAGRPNKAFGAQQEKYRDLGHTSDIFLIQLSGRDGSRSQPLMKPIGKANEAKQQQRSLLLSEMAEKTHEEIKAPKNLSSSERSTGNGGAILGCYRAPQSLPKKIIHVASPRKNAAIVSVSRGRLLT